LHREPKQFVASVKKQYPEYFTGKKVLEVGSLDINGSVRPFFTDCDYTGIDLGEGPGVDKVTHLIDWSRQKFGIQSESYDVIISTESLEHDRLWEETLRVMLASLRLNGLLVITCAAPNRPEHGTTRTGSAEASPFTSDYYRNISVEDFASVLPPSLFSKSYLGYRGNMDDLYFAGIKAAPMGSNITSWKEYYEQSAPQPKLTVTCEISTKDRYHVLPMCISAILTQTRKPERLVIYDDGEQKDLRTFSPFDGLLRLADHLGIQWEFFATPREGQVRNHQHALDTCQTDLIFRCDDDCIPEPDCLEKLLAEMADGAGAVAPLIHHPCGVSPLPPTVDGSLNDVALGVNMQWFDLSGEARDVSHLYSGFLYRVSAGREADGYPKNLSCIGHHEETIFSHNIKKAGYALKVVPAAKMFHFHEATGGIRSFSDTSLWEHDEQIFQEYMKTVGHVSRETTLHVLDCGTGDALCYRAVFLDHIRRKYPERHYTLAVCQPEVYEGLDNVTIISIAEAKTMVGDKYEDYSLYAWCWKNGWKGSIVDAMIAFYGAS
jgi:hypothetical protein